MVIDTQDQGYDMQPEFDKNNSKAAMVNYSKIKSGGEIQDDLRKLEKHEKDG
jgi:hypothetical protein